MTNREFYNAILSLDILDEDIRSHAMHNLELLDKKNASRSSKPSKVQLENVPIKASILEYLIGKSVTITKDIAESVGQSPNKVGALCRQLRDEGKLVEVEVKIPKVGTRKAYKLAESDDASDEVDE